MPNFGLPLLLNWRLLRKTLILKSKVYAERVYTICKNGVGKVAKTGQHGGKQHALKQPADHWNKSSDTPLSGKEKGDTVFTVH